MGNVIVSFCATRARKKKGGRELENVIHETVPRGIVASRPKIWPISSTPESRDRAADDCHRTHRFPNNYFVPSCRRQRIIVG